MANKENPLNRITGRGLKYIDGLPLYLKQAVETPLLTPQEEVSLAKRIHAGDADAREHMIKANLRLVVKIAKEYDQYGLPLLDLINEGNVGLMRAVERFDPNKGARLATYAAWWIKQSIKRALSNQIKQIRIPIHLGLSISRLHRAESVFEAKHGRPASDSELALILNVAEDDIESWRESAYVGTVSIDAALLNDPDGPTLAEIIPDEAVAMPWKNISGATNTDFVRELVSKLNGQEQDILTRRFGLNGNDPETLEKIGDIYGLTRERIRQIQNTALKNLREMLEQRERISDPDMWDAVKRVNRN